jgi:acetolactate synthase I/II/III large subunit
VKKLIRNLTDSGIIYAFGITGSGASLKLIAGLQRAGVEYYPVSHEAAAAFMAGSCCRDGISRAAAITIKGPGFINLMPGIVSNYYENRPALTISESYSQDTPLFKTHKRLNHELICQSVCKAYGFSSDKGVVSRLLRKAQKDPPGPVHLDLVGDFNTVEDNSPKIEDKKLPIDKQYIHILKEYLQNSKCPCLILGSLAARLNFDWNLIKVPVVTTAAAKGCYDETSIYSAGVITGEVTKFSPESSALYKSDLIIAIGLRNTEVIKIESYSVPLVMIDNIGLDLQEGFGPDLLIINNDLSGIFTILLESLASKSWGADILAKQKYDIYKALLSEQWLTAKAFNALQKNMVDETILVLDTGFFCTVGETIWKAKSSNLFCGSSIGRFMGSAIPTAIGVSISSKDNPVLCVMGDGGISPYFGEISFAVKEQLPIVFVLMTDGRYGSVAAFSPDDVETERAVNIGVDSWCDAIRGLNCEAIQATNEIELIKALNNWKGKTVPLFIELPFEPEDYARTSIKLR